jgi:hypothetical protein
VNAQILFSCGKYFLTNHGIGVAFEFSFNMVIGCAMPNNRSGEEAHYACKYL